MDRGGKTGDRSSDTVRQGVINCTALAEGYCTALAATRYEDNLKKFLGGTMDRRQAMARGQNKHLEKLAERREPLTTAGLLTEVEEPPVLIVSREVIATFRNSPGQSSTVEDVERPWEAIEMDGCGPFFFRKDDGGTVGQVVSQALAAWGKEPVEGWLTIGSRSLNAHEKAAELPPGSSIRLRLKTTNEVDECSVRGLCNDPICASEAV